MTNSEYWEKRIASATWKTYNSMEEKNQELLEFYVDASKAVKEELYTLAEKYSRDGVLTLTEMHKQGRLTRLNRQYEKIVKDLGQKVQDAAEENMEKGFNEVYKSSGMDPAVEFAMPNKKLMQKLLNEPWRGDVFSGRLWKNQKRLAVGLNDLLLKGLQQGKTPTEIAVSLHNLMGKSFNDCHRLVRTESMHYLNSATLQRYRDEGVEYVQVWAAEDERTCDTCGSYHEKIYPIEQCPTLPFHPNCRCTILPVTDEKKIAEHEKRMNPEKMDDDYQERIRQRRAAYRRREEKRSTAMETPDFSSMNRDELLQWAKSHLKTDIGDLKGVNIDYARDTVKVLSEFEHKMGGSTIPGLKVRFGGLDRSVSAKYDDKENALVLKKTGSKAAFEKSQREANIRYRIRWKRDKDYYATETYSGTIWHELGHAVDLSIHEALSRKLSSDARLEELSVKISSYAGSTQNIRTSKRSEAWAENFAAYMEGGKNKSKVPKEIADMIEEYFEKNIEKHSSNDTMKQGLIGGGKQSAIRKHTHQRTANMSSSEYARAKDLWQKNQELILPGKEREHIYEELDNNLSMEEKEQCIVRRCIGNYRYTAINKGHNQYKIISKEPILETTGDTNIDSILDDVLDFDWRRFL